MLPSEMYRCAYKGFIEGSPVMCCRSAPKALVLLSAQLLVSRAELILSCSVTHPDKIQCPEAGQTPAQ